MREKATICFVVILVMVLINAGFQSTGPEGKPELNIYGKVKYDGFERNGRQITISGTYKGITVYEVPATQDYEPKSSTSINLQKNHANPGQSIVEIRRPSLEENVKKYGKRKYVEIEVVRKNGETQRYLFPQNKRVNYYRVDPAGKMYHEPIEFGIEILESLKIEGQRYGQTSKEKKEEASAAKEVVCTDMKRELENLGKNPAINKALIQRLKDNRQLMCG